MVRRISCGEEHTIMIILVGLRFVCPRSGFERRWRVAHELFSSNPEKLWESSTSKEMKPNYLNNIPLSAITLPPTEELVRPIQPAKVEEYMNMMKLSKPFS